jgi:hypothetical protein
VGGEGQRTQYLRQGRRAQFGRSASAAGERGQSYLVSGLHGVVLSIRRHRRGTGPLLLAMIGGGLGSVKRMRG